MGRGSSGGRVDAQALQETGTQFGEAGIGDVARFGSVSKSLAPAVRLGWMVLPEELVPEFVTVKGYGDYMTSALEQLTLAEFIASGAYDRHVRLMRQRYRRRRDQLVEALCQRAPGIRVAGVAAGLQTVVDLPRGTESSVVRAAARQGLAVSGLTQFAYEVADSGWRLPERDALVVNYAAPSDSAWAGALDTLCRVMPRCPESQGLCDVSDQSRRSGRKAMVTRRQLPDEHGRGRAIEVPGRPATDARNYPDLLGVTGTPGVATPAAPSGRPATTASVRRTRPRWPTWWPTCPRTPPSRTRRRRSPQERQPDLTPGVVPVRVHQDDGLPGSQLQRSTDHGERRVGRDDGREYVVPAMTWGAVPVLPAVVCREELVEGGQEVVITARAGLDHGQARRRVGREDVEQAVPAGGHFP